MGNMIDRIIEELDKVIFKKNLYGTEIATIRIQVAENEIEELTGSEFFFWNYDYTNKTLEVSCTVFEYLRMCKERNNKC